MANDKLQAFFSFYFVKLRKTVSAFKSSSKKFANQFDAKKTIILTCQLSQVSSESEIGMQMMQNFMEPCLENKVSLSIRNCKGQPCLCYFIHLHFTGFKMHFSTCSCHIFRKVSTLLDSFQLLKLDLRYFLFSISKNFNMMTHPTLLQILQN